MFRLLLAAIVTLFASTVLFAEEKKSVLDFSGDRFVAGATSVHDTENVDDLFMVGETVRSEKSIAGSAHLAGRKVISKGAIGGDAYLAGMDVSLEGRVAGDLRVSGSKLIISGPVAGYALIAGEDVQIKSVFKGDVSLAAQDLEFADGARIEGKLTIYEKTIGDMDIPAAAVSEDRLERQEISQWSADAAKLVEWDWRAALGQFVLGVLVVAGIAALIAALLPERLASLRRGILDQPFWTLWVGVLAESVIIGSTVILMMTVIGLLLAPATILLALAGAFAGYVVGAYAFGVGLLMATGRSEPNNIGTRAAAAGVGALAAGLIALIPFFGWLFVIALALAGLGSIAVWVFRPKFFANV